MPTGTISEEIDTRLIIELIVVINDEISSVKILRSVNSFFDSHVIEVLRNMPDGNQDMTMAK